MLRDSDELKPEEPERQEPTLAEAARAAIKARVSERYEIIEGDPPDAVIKFGKHWGERISMLAIQQPDYLTWILGEGFDNILKRIIIAHGIRPPRMRPRDELMLKTKPELVTILRALAIEDDGHEPMNLLLKIDRGDKATKERITEAILNAKRRIRAR